MNTWVTYKNGNYVVYFNKNNGTKIRKNDLDFFYPEFPESFDYKITNRCRHNCSMCHEASTPDGLHGDILNDEFINTLHPYTELALGGGNPLEHPDLESFLYKCKDLNLIPSMTVHQGDFMDNFDYLCKLRDERLLYGFGVSISYVTDQLINCLKQFPNAVCHIIAGVVTEDVINKLKNNNLKILILGYKKFRKGAELYSRDEENINNKIDFIYNILPVMFKENWFNTISFDNLAIKQLNPSRLLSDAEYDEFYMGDDGQFTMFIDSVTKTFTVSSTCEERWPIMNNIVDMFNHVREYNKQN